MAKTRDMTVGSPIKLIFGFFLPLLFGLLFQQLYNAVDTVVVGRFLGVNALAGVGANSPPDRVLRTAKPYGAICRPQVSRSIRIQSEGL